MYNNANESKTLKNPIKDTFINKIHLNINKLKTI